MNLYQEYSIVNDILLKHGIQQGNELLKQAFISLGKRGGGFGDEEFPVVLEKHREWFSKLMLGDVDLLLTYSERARSLADRYWRKKRK